MTLFATVTTLGAAIALLFAVAAWHTASLSSSSAPPVSLSAGPASSSVAQETSRLASDALSLPSSCPLYPPTELSAPFALQYAQLVLQELDVAGTVVCACIVGSQAYNLAIDSSDIDIQVIYAWHDALDDDADSCVPFERTRMWHLQSQHPERHLPADLLFVEVSEFAENLRQSVLYEIDLLYLDRWCAFAPALWQPLRSQRDSVLVREQYVDAALENARKLLRVRALGGTQRPKVPYHIVRQLSRAVALCERGEPLSVWFDEQAPLRAELLAIRGGRKRADDVEARIADLVQELERYTAPPATRDLAVVRAKEELLRAWLVSVRHCVRREGGPVEYIYI